MAALALSPAALDWVLRAVPDQQLRQVHPLPGSTSASLHRLAFQSGFHAVLRQFDLLPNWLVSEPDLARHEAHSLMRAARAGLPTPELIAFDETGAEAGSPSVLMTCLPGEVDLNPPDRHLWLDGLAAALTDIHAVSPVGFGWAYAPYSDVGQLTLPTWTSVPDAWSRAMTQLQEPPPTFTPTFIHRDFHPANVLWQADQVSGVVDWVNACAGPAGADVGHCQVNLAQMYGLEAADAFKAAYERRTGQHQHRYWDLLGLADFMNGDEPPHVYPGWPALGLTGLTDEVVQTRLDRYLVRLLGDDNGTSRSGSLLSLEAPAGNVAAPVRRLPRLRKT
ncbi:phosphotransferase family protein [Deinococcus alpinitundrae]|uniref:phosphotransferase family protein n=1 Tax=Deinococcus alpinitundrae TaxID=468913 RepID=UPI00137971B1|nr:aminoglycoside phosphotransferase family protein [Deinococcus alpinitundrae]